MAAAALRQDSWHVEHLGSNMPPDELVRFCAESTMGVAVITSTNSDTASIASETAVALPRSRHTRNRRCSGRTLDELIELARLASRTGRR